MTSLPPAALLLLGAAVVPLVRGRARQTLLLALPVASFVHLLALPPGESLRLTLFDLTLTLARNDRLAFCFGVIFHIVAFLSVLYALHVRDTVQHVAGLLYAGAGIGAVFAGDLLTLFVYWELTAVASVFLIWANRTRRAFRVGMRYLVIQIGSGVLLLAGALYHVSETGSLAFDHLGLAGTGGKLIFLAFGIKCAFPLLHNWLQDAYPEGTVTGTVFLSAFTTKLAVYALARGYAGIELLVPIGVAMTLFPIFYAVIENDLRRVLAYSLNNQLGFMVVGIGIGTEMSLNGTVAHAFAHLLYKALLFMSMGALLHRAGTVKASELGGLYRSMPWTAGFCIVGAASISAFPLTSGFVSKSLIMTAAGDEHRWLTLLLLLAASAGVMEHSGIKIPFFGFFGHDSGIRCKEAPLNMLLAMGGAAFLCLAIGIVPWPLYDLLPYAVGYEPYTATHVVTQFQLLLGAAVAFVFLMWRRWYPAERPSVNLDFDWTYRRALPALVGAVTRIVVAVRSAATRAALSLTRGGVTWVERHTGATGLFGRTWEIGGTVAWITLVFVVFLVMYYSRGGG